MLGRRRCERGSDLAVQRPSRPKTSGPIQERRHLRRHAAIARAGADDDGIVVRKVLNRRDWRLLVELVTRIARSEEHTSELQSLMRTSDAAFCLKKKNQSNERRRPVRHMQRQ